MTERNTLYTVRTDDGQTEAVRSAATVGCLGADSDISLFLCHDKPAVGVDRGDLGVTCAPEYTFLGGVGRANRRRAEKRVAYIHGIGMIRDADRTDGNVGARAAATVAA